MPHLYDFDQPHTVALYRALQVAQRHWLDADTVAARPGELALVQQIAEWLREDLDVLLGPDD